MSEITATFSNLEQEKQLKILNAAFQEFAEKGYNQASTNRIVKEAGIGKGMLFYYFKSKKELYHYLVEYGKNFVLNEYLNKIDESETDFIKRYQQAGQTKMAAYAKCPNIFNFLGSIYLNKEYLLSAELESQMIAAQKLGYSKLFTNIDTSLFREDVAAEQVIKLIQWSMDGYTNELTHRLEGKNLAAVDMDPHWDEYYEFLATLKIIYYKQGRAKDDSSENK